MDDTRPCGQGCGALRRSGRLCGQAGAAALLVEEPVELEEVLEDDESAVDLLDELPFSEDDFDCSPDFAEPSDLAEPSDFAEPSEDEPSEAEPDDRLSVR